MREEIKFGGRYFTIKRNKNDDMDTLTINVSEPTEMVREIVNSNQSGTEKIKEYYSAKDIDWDKALYETAIYLVENLLQMKIFMDTDIDVDFTLVDFSRDFDYEKIVKINNISTILKFSVKRHGWKQSFVKSFIKVYNNNINKG